MFGFSTKSLKLIKLMYFYYTCCTGFFFFFSWCPFHFLFDPFSHIENGIVFR